MLFVLFQSASHATGCGKRNKEFMHYQNGIIQHFPGHVGHNLTTDELREPTMATIQSVIDRYNHLNIILAGLSNRWDGNGTGM